MFDYRQRLLATTFMVSAGVLAGPALAQDAPATDPAAQAPTGPVEAAPAPEAAATGEPVEQPRDIVVTGTRIPSANLESVAPVTVVSGQDFKLQGNTRVEDLLNSLPSVGASMTSSMSNGATGTAEADLRYLGSKRTLTLINGRRLAPGDPAGTTQAADLNMIPSSLVKRAEVLTGGASSTYGADAVAGVVNFIMDTDFTGIRLDGQYSFYQHNNGDPGITNGRHVSDALDAQIAAGLSGYGYPTGSVADGGTFDGTIAIGTKFDDDRGHAMAYFGYRKVKAVTQARRDFSTCGLSGAGNPTCGGSATSAEGNAFIFVPRVDNPNTPVVETGFATTTFTFDRENPGDLVPGISLYNFNPTNYFQRPDERYIAGAFANYEVTPAIKPYLEFMFMDDFTSAQIAPSGDFGNTFTLNCDNPFMSATTRDDIVCADHNLINGFLGAFPLAVGAGYNPNPAAPPLTFVDGAGTPYNIGYLNLLRRNVEGGPRIAELSHTNFRGVLGTRGDLGKVWSYDAYYQYGRTNYSQVFRNEFSLSRLNRALNAVIDPRVGSPTFGQPVCRSVLDNSDPNCRPYDIFGTPSDAAINYLNVFGVMEGKTSEQVANINFTGALGDYGMQLPWAEDGIGVNAGFEYRKESLVLNPDQSFQSGDLTGQGAPTLAVDGEFDVKEIFAEAQIPIVQSNFIHELTLTGGYRKSWYSTHSDQLGSEFDRKYDTDTYKVGLEFAPIRDVRFRAAYNRAVRAPNIQELFAPQFVGLDGSTDPCAGHAIEADELGCRAQGLQVGQETPLNPAEQYNGRLGGNPLLNPEKATTKTVGVVLQPSFIPRLAFTVDYWTIKLEDAIQGFGADTVLADCIAKTTDLANPAPSCALIHRNPGGSIWLSPDGFVEDTPTNVGGIKTSGFDFNGSYSHRLGGIGNLSVSFIGTWLKKYITDNGLAEPYDCAGFYGSTCSGGTVSSSAPMPKWRHKARATLQMPSGIGISLQWRMMGKVQHERNSDDEALNSAGNPPQLGNKIKAQHYLDLATTFAFGDHYNFRLGVNNILDNDPPLVTSSAGTCPTGPCNGNTYPGTWDALGRYVYAGVTLDF